jgi:dTDP-glucose 4,6-dehydratase
MSLKHYQPRNVLITGGAGFIGANFVRYLLGKDESLHIVNLDLLTYAGSLKNIEDLPNPSHHAFIQGDICDEALVSSILEKKEIDTIVHFAAESHVDRSIEGPFPFIRTNLLGTFTLLEAARKEWLENRKLDKTRCRFHHISTDEVFGSLSKKDPAFTEKTAYAPNSPYSASKAGSDHLVRAYAHTYGLPTTLSHCSNNYGPYQHPEKLIPTIIHACRDQTIIPIYGDGSNVRDWLYVEDHCSALYDILTRGEVGEVYNIGGSHEVNNLALAHHICDVMATLYPQKKSYRELIQFVKDRKGHDWRYAIDHTKLTTSLGWKPQETFESGLHKTILFYMD